MGGGGDPDGAVSKRGEEHGAGCGLLVPSVLHNFTAGLPQVPELRAHGRISEQLVAQLASTLHNELVRKLLHI